MGCGHLRERGAGTLVAAAAGDALGAPFEGGLPPPGWADLAGGGPRDLEPGEWTDDTALTLAVAEVAATGIDLRRDEALDRIGDRFLDWYRAGAPGIGATTRRALSRARSGADLRRAAVALPRRASRSASNGALMRTAPVALAHLGDDPAMAEAAVGVARLTHPDELAAESCVIWCIAIDRAIREDRIDGAWDALEQLPIGARRRWGRWLAETRERPARSFRPNGHTVACLQAALAAALQTPGSRLAASLRAAVEIGDDTDTVACVAGALLGARWGRSEIPTRWRDRLHDRWGHTADDLERLAFAIVDRRSGCDGGGRGSRAEARTRV